MFVNKCSTIKDELKKSGNKSFTTSRFLVEKAKPSYGGVAFLTKNLLVVALLLPPFSSSPFILDHSNNFGICFFILINR